jgi:hypothetical protein
MDCDVREMAGYAAILQKGWKHRQAGTKREINAGLDVPFVSGGWRGGGVYFFL